MSEKLVIVPRKVRESEKVLNVGLFAVACVFIGAAIFVSTATFLLPAIVATGIWVWRSYYCNIEYEYTYYEGELHMARITNKARRKNLADLNLEEVVTIAPKGDRSVYKYETDKNIMYRNYTSGEEASKVYELIYKTDNGICRYEFEPDEEMLKAIKVKYPHTIVI